ncbi:MAG: hypothetical protein AAGF46_11440, partial [Pseudomonadota bacterium]
MRTATKFTSLLALTAVFSIGCSDAPPPEPPAGPSVGMQRFNWVDTTRRDWQDTGPRPVTSTVWYPTDTSEQSLIQIPEKRPVFLAGFAARNAPLADSDRRLPVVVL